MTLLRFSRSRRWTTGSFFLDDLFEGGAIHTYFRLWVGGLSTYGAWFVLSWEPSPPHSLRAQTISQGEVRRWCSCLLSAAVAAMSWMASNVACAEW